MQRDWKDGRKKLKVEHRENEDSKVPEKRRKEKCRLVVEREEYREDERI